MSIFRQAVLELGIGAATHVCTGDLHQRRFTDVIHELKSALVDPGVSSSRGVHMLRAK